MVTKHVLAGAIAATLLCSGAASATHFSKVVVIGDSLSDAGNLSLALYPQIQPPNRFTTNPGSTAAELVASDLGLPVTPSLLGGTDYAFGGAGVVHNASAGPIPTLPQQLQMYLAANGGAADPHALYQVWGGANDIFYLSATSTNPNVLSAGTQVAAQTELGLLNTLHAAGATYAVVYNLPDLGKTPAGMAGGAAASGGATQLSQLYNSQLSLGLSDLSAQGMNIIPVNTFALVNQVIANPAAYGFSNVTAPACGATASSLLCGPQGAGLPFSYAPGTENTYLFADDVHPTTAAHALLAQVVKSELAAPEQVSLLGEAPLAITGVQNGVLRSQMIKDSLGAERRAFVNIDYAQQRFDGTDSSPQTNSNNLNFTLGYDMKFSDHLSGGVALGVARNDANVAGGGGYRLKDYSGLGFVSWQAGGGYVGGYASYGQSTYSDVNRVFQIGPVRTRESGSTGGSHRGLGLTGGWWFDVGSLKTGPFATLDWQDIRVGGYYENGKDATSMRFGDQTRKALVSTLGWRVQGQWQVQNLIMTPYLELAWSHDSKADLREVSAGLNTMGGSFAVTGFAPDKNWGFANIGLSAQLTPTVSSWIGYGGRFSDHSQKYNSFNMGFKIGL